MLYFAYIYYMVDTKNMRDKLSYFYDKLPEKKDNYEPLSLLMVRTVREAFNYIKTHRTSKMETIQSNNINLLHSIDRKPALDKLKRRVDFLKKNKQFIKETERAKGYIDLTSDFFLDSPFNSINSEKVAEIKNNKYVTLSGVGRICAIKIVFPEGLKIKVQVGKVDECLAKRLIGINNLYIYGLRFNNLRKYNIDENEILIKKKSDTRKCYRRGKFLTKRKKSFSSKFIPYK